MGAAQSSRDAIIKHAAAVVVNTKLPQKAAVDATLAQNLKRIGQVNVQSPASLQRSLQMTHVLRTRALSEPTDSDASSPSSNTIDSFRLSELLDARKDASSSPHQLAERYHLDEPLIQRLAMRYNSPSIGREHTIGLPDGDRRVYREAIWQ